MLPGRQHRAIPTSVGKRLEKSNIFIRERSAPSCLSHTAVVLRVLPAAPFPNPSYIIASSSADVTGPVAVLAAAFTFATSSAVTALALLPHELRT